MPFLTSTLLQLGWVKWWVPFGNAIVITLIVVVVSYGIYVLVIKPFL